MLCVKPVEEEKKESTVDKVSGEHATHTEAEASTTQQVRSMCQRRVGCVVDKKIKFNPPEE